MLLWILFVVSVIFCYVKFWKPLSYWENKNVPHLKSWPIVGNFVKVFFRGISFPERLQEIYNQTDSRYLGYFNLMTPNLMIKDLELIKQITIKDFDSFTDHRRVVDADDLLFGKALFALKGKKWRNMRSVLSPAFTSSKMKSMFVLISECADQFTNQLLKTCEGNSYQTVEMKDIYTRFANDVIASCAFGIKCDSLTDKENEFYIMGKRVTEFGGLGLFKIFLYNISPFICKLFKIKFVNEEISNFFRYLISSTIDSREKHGIVRPDMIHLLMEARKGKLKHEDVKVKDEDAGFATVEESQVGKEEQTGGKKLSDDEITAQALGFFFAGFDTVSNLMAQMAYELALYPEVQQKLRQEVDETLELCNGKITYDIVAKMKYMDMVVSETMRKWPAIMTDRECTNNYVIEAKNPNEKPIILNKGDVVVIPIHAIQRDPKYFPDPDRFDPERFSDENKHNINPSSYIPFGVGPRNCIGSRFALMETKTMFVHLLSKFDIDVDKKTMIPIKLSKKGFNLAPENGFWLRIRQRIVQ